MSSDPRFSAGLSDGNKRVDLEISSAALTDSALYYCAVRPTVTGNTHTLYKNLHTVFVSRNTSVLLKAFS